METVSECPLRVASVVWQSSSGAWILTVACKATYELRRGTSLLASKQHDPHTTDNYWDADPTCSLLAPSDLSPFKTRADVLVVGHVSVPQGTQVQSLVARVAVGAVDPVSSSGALKRRKRCRMKAGLFLKRS